MQYPFNDDLPNTELFDIQDVAVLSLFSVENRLFPVKVNIALVASQHSHYTLRAIPPPQPLNSLSVSCSTICSNADQPVPTALLHEITKHFSHLRESKPQVYKELREHLDRLSLFAGRNPLVSSCVAVL